MNGFFKWITGKTWREKRWTEAPRMLPSHFTQRPPDDVIFGQEFQLRKDKQFRQYILAERHGDGWKIYECECNHKSGDLNISMIEYNAKLFNVIARIAAYDRSMMQYSNIFCLENKDSVPNYKTIALQKGIHFAANGKPYMPTASSGIKKSVTLSGDNFRAVFNREKVDAEAKANWNQMNGILNEVWAQVQHTEEMTQTQSFMNFCYRATRFLKKLESLDTKNATVQEAGTLLKAFSNGRLHADGFFMDEESKRRAKRLIRSSALKTIAEATAVIYVDAADQGAFVDPASLALIQTGSDMVQTIAVEDFCTYDKAVSLKDTIMAGIDPAPSKLPLRKFLEKFYPDFEKEYEHTNLASHNSLGAFLTDKPEPQQQRRGGPGDRG